MKNRIHRFIAYTLIVTALCIGCKSEFEKIRLSNNPTKILESSIKYYEDGEYLRAQTLFELILNQYRGTKDAEKLFYYYAYTHYHLRQYQLASHYFKNFSNTFAYSQYREEADYMSAYANYRLSPGYRLDQKPTYDAIEGFQEFVNRYPKSERVAETNRLIDQLRGKLEQKSQSQGMLYLDLEQYEAAITAFENTLEEFPETDQAASIRFSIFKASYLYAVNSIFERRQERFEESLKRFEDFKSKYSNSEFFKPAEDLYNDIQKQLKTLKKNDRYQN
jgi:outer membrane protein assembly factor BamD